MSQTSDGRDAADADRPSPLIESLAASDEARRRAIADALHDGPVQDLASLSIRLGTYRAGLDDAGHQTTIAQFEHTVRDAIDGIRALMLELAPPEVDGDLVGAIEAYANEALGTDTEVTVRAEPLDAVDDTTARSAFTIVQQALSNVRGHARASHADVCLSVEDGALAGEIRDDGVGASAERLVVPQPGHFGLRRMREHADALGGWVRVASNPGSGVTVRFRLPLTQQELRNG